ncbi:hypothetical protein O3P69_001611 [Scylla paramamosain]|uniref:Uncharacterized protein n=1 Tax=Scylla paramamosain TaxID=85552 RepID=A0AAW0UYI9_SCYPA
MMGEDGALSSRGGEEGSNQLLFSLYLLVLHPVGRYSHLSWFPVWPLEGRRRELSLATLHPRPLSCFCASPTTTATTTEPTPPQAPPPPPYTAPVSTLSLQHLPPPTAPPTNSPTTPLTFLTSPLHTPTPRLPPPPPPPPTRPGAQISSNTPHQLHLRSLILLSNEMHYKFNPFTGRLSTPSTLEVPNVSVRRWRCWWSWWW